MYKFIKSFLSVWLFFVLIWGSVNVILAYVIWHFITKFW